MEHINDIPIISMADVIKPVLARYCRDESDPEIRKDILSEIKAKVQSGDLDSMRQFLSQDESVWIGNLQHAYFRRFEGIEPLDDYPEWAQAKCSLLIAIAEQTREDDGIIQHLLNYEDFHIEVFPFSFGPSFIVSLYELRGLDFFLYHYMGGETSAHEDGVLFDHAESVTKSLAKLGRTTEAKLVERELEARKRRLNEIQRDFQRPEYDPSTNLIARIRIAGERFWSDYLMPDVWTRVDQQSAAELVDAFSTEYLLKQEILSTWSTVVLALCRVVERETARAIFTPWKQHFQMAVWSPPQAESKKARKRLESRQMTFKMLQSCSSDKGHSPTLGQLVFVAKFWDDPVMDSCTDMFQNIRNQANRTSSDFSQRVANLAVFLQQPLSIDGAAMTIPDARNSSAHPREDEDIAWSLFIEHLKKTLGKPPAELLKLVVGLTISANAAQRC
jgi:hypothetical protein